MQHSGVRGSIVTRIAQAEIYLKDQLELPASQGIEEQARNPGRDTEVRSSFLLRKINKWVPQWKMRERKKRMEGEELRAGKKLDKDRPWEPS